MTHPIIYKTSRRPTVKGFGSRSCRRKVLPNAVRVRREMPGGQIACVGQHTGRHTRRIFAAFNIYNYKNDIPIGEQ